jgi:hypothetical protein
MSCPLPAKLNAAPVAILEPQAYVVYQADFRTARPAPAFRTGAVKVVSAPHIANANREHSYWHAVTEGNPEATRTMAISERLERVPWMRPILDGWPTCKVWWESRESSQHWNIWHANARYVVIVKELSNGYLLKTAYPTGPDAAKWHRRFADAKKTGRALASAA